MFLALLCFVETKPNSFVLFCISVPIPTYILGPTEKQEVSYFSSVSLDNGGELCDNLTYLGIKDAAVECARSSN